MAAPFVFLSVVVVSHHYDDIARPVVTLDRWTVFVSEVRRHNPRGMSGDPPRLAAGSSHACFGWSCRIGGRQSSDV
jgi:hypothetical protein